MTTEQNSPSVESTAAAESLPRFEDLSPELQEIWLDAMRRCRHASLADSLESHCKAKHTQSAHLSPENHMTTTQETLSPSAADASTLCGIAEATESKAAQKTGDPIPRFVDLDAEMQAIYKDALLQSGYDPKRFGI